MFQTIRLPVLIGLLSSPWWYTVNCCSYWCTVHSVFCCDSRGLTMLLRTYWNYTHAVSFAYDLPNECFTSLLLPLSFWTCSFFIVNGEWGLSLISGRLMQTHHMFFVLFISLLHLLWEDNTGATLDVNSLMVWFTVLSDNYSSRLLSFTWHFLSAAPDEIAVYHFLPVMLQHFFTMWAITSHCHA